MLCYACRYEGAHGLVEELHCVVDAVKIENGHLRGEVVPGKYIICLFVCVCLCVNFKIDNGHMRGEVENILAFRVYLLCVFGA